MKYNGLNDEEVLKKRNDFGLNKIKEKNEANPILIYLYQLRSPLIYILIFAAIIAIILGEQKEAIFIFIVILINSILGFYQEYKAEATLQKLKKGISKTAKVIRNGKIQVIPTVDLVPGDLVMLESGIRVPGDGEIIEANDLMIEEAVLTGESEPAKKKIMADCIKAEAQDGQVFMGTLVISGLGIAKIKQTGSNTQFGKIAYNVTIAKEPPTPIKVELNKISRIISFIVILIIFLVIGLGLLKEMELFEILLIAVALGVSTIPEGLIISMTTTLAIGMNRIMKKKAIVKNLPAAETLGSIDVLCIDKTGTLTYGTMQVIENEFVDEAIAFKAIGMSNNNHNSIDKALEIFGRNNMKATEFDKFQDDRVAVIPFSSMRKYTASTDGAHIYVVGAPEKLLENSIGNVDKWKEMIHSKSALGHRLVGVAYRKHQSSKLNENDIHSLHFIGLISIKDPVRESVGLAMEKVQKAGVDVKVVTGDLKETSLNVLKAIHYNIKNDEVVAGHDLRSITSEEEFDKVVANTKLFYRTTPDQKFDIVVSLQRQKFKVGMMGDGVNDAPALKRAEIGIAVDNASDVSKEVADIVLLDSDFNTVADAIEEGRNIFQTLRKIVSYQFINTFSETNVIILSLVFNLSIPLTAILLLWINILIDGLPALALSFEDFKKGTLLKKRPKGKYTLFNPKRLVRMMVISVCIDILLFAFYLYLSSFDFELEYRQTFVFAIFSLTSLLLIYSAKTIETNLWKEPLFNNKVVNISVIISTALILVSIYFEPIRGFLNTRWLSPIDLLYVVIFSFTTIFFIEMAKLVIHRMERNMRLGGSKSIF